MLVPLLHVLFVALRTVFRSALNIMLYSVFSRIFNKWLGFNSLISFFCSAYCLSKVAGYFKRIWQQAQLNAKKPDEKIALEDLTWQSTATIRNNQQDEAMIQFETDWQYLLTDYVKFIFPSIVNVPFNNGWLFIATILIIDYQTNSLHYSYIVSLLRTMGVLIVLICGSSIRYQTLHERDRQDILNLMMKKRDEIERSIVYSKNNKLPLASICLQTSDDSETSTFIVHLYQINSKFEDYIHDISNYVCQQLIERMGVYANEHKRSVRLIWSIPSCQQNWTWSMKKNKFTLKETYKEFSFLPLVNSSIEQYQYLYEYRNEDN